MRGVVVGALALSLIGGAAARAQGPENVPGVLAAAVDQLGQGVGEAALGGQNVFVTAKGAVKLPAPPPRAYDLPVEGQGPTAVEAAKLRDDKVEKLRAAAKRFSVAMTVGDPSYVAARPVIAPRISLPSTGNSAAVTVPPPASATPRGAGAEVTARVPVQFVRPPPAQMPAFLDALREAGVDALPDTNVAANPLAQLTQIFGIGGGAPAPASVVDEETWARASAAAMQAAKAEAEALAAPAGRHVGPLRQATLLTRSVQNGEAVVLVSARFGFAPEK